MHQLIAPVLPSHISYSQCKSLHTIDTRVLGLKLPGDVTTFLFPGEVFVEMSAEQTGEMILTYKGKIQSDIQALKDKAADIENNMKELKSELYGKFGSAINLEYD